MDSKIVSREIRREIWPVLKKEGFDCFVSRTAWRHSAGKIDVVNFQSFNSYLAGGIHCTTFSFALNLGCFLNFVPEQLHVRIAERHEVKLPQEHECHLRRHLQKTIQQAELSRSDVWFIGNHGEYLAESITDALTQIRQVGFPLVRSVREHRRN